MSLMRSIAGLCRGAVGARLPAVFGFLLAHRRDVVGGLVALAAVVLIVVNGLFMQAGPHPAPIFAIKPLPVVANEPTGAVVPRPRPAAVVDAPKPEPASVPVPAPRPRAQAAHSDPIAELIAQQPHPLSAVQRALNEYGYGPVKSTGVYDEATRAAITRFEKDHNLPPTGQVTPRFRRELAAATGRPLD
ncbi:MAG: peptidoglycan-binding protein [Xanthobacteraceae bacterium]|nr:peptidoglycan-binding protein [Xanthobacteraceae bacterium]